MTAAARLARYCASLLVVAVAVFISSPSFAAQPLATKTMEHGGRTRTYHVLVPDGYDPKKPTPLVLALHGGGGQGLKMDRSTHGQFKREADRKDWLVVFPEGVKNGWNDHREATSNPRKDVDDVAFLTALIDEVAQDYAVDKKRVYATGISNGGFMSILLALEASDRIAAVAPVTANLAELHRDKRPARRIPILFMNGTDDPLVPYNGGHVVVLGQKRGEILSTDESALIFAAHNGCTGEAPQVTLPNWSKKDGTRTVVRRGAGCSAPVVIYRVEGGGHTWPGGMQYLPKKLIGPVSRDFSGTRHIFDFFAPHRLP